MRLVRYTYPTFRSLASAPGAFQRSPWSGLETEIDRLFTSVATNFGSGIASASTRFPLDLFEDKNNAYVRAELPGVNRDEIKVELVEGNLTVTASRKTTSGEAKDSEESTFTRSVRVPDNIQADKVSAAYENGVLTVTLPKQEEVKPQKITVAVK